MIRYELHREADGELYAAAACYEAHVEGLGLELIDEVEQAIEWVCAHPEASQRWPDVPAELGIRRKLLRRFPFGLAYLQAHAVIVVLAVAHLSRKPGYWLDRANAYA